MSFILIVVFAAIFFYALRSVIKAVARDGVPADRKSLDDAKDTGSADRGQRGCRPHVHDADITAAYSAVAEEYTSVVGSIEAMHEADRERIKHWAMQVDGPIVDAGCGPGHWTDFLYRCGADIAGIDLVPEFIEGARTRFPGVPFEVSSLRTLRMGDGTMAGIMAWYSLIHMPPWEVSAVLAEFARVLPPQGQLLLGFFAGTAGAPMAHAVTQAYYWSTEQMTDVLQEAGFAVVDIETRHDPGSRPHAAIAAARMQFKEKENQP